MSRANASAPRGERAVVLEPFATADNISVIGALTLGGVHILLMRAVSLIRFALNSGVFIRLIVRLFIHRYNLSLLPT